MSTSFYKIITNEHELNVRETPKSEEYRYTQAFYKCTNGLRVRESLGRVQYGPGVHTLIIGRVRRIQARFARHGAHG